MGAFRFHALLQRLLVTAALPLGFARGGHRARFCSQRRQWRKKRDEFQL
jgi:hypothetical protein